MMNEKDRRVWVSTASSSSVVVFCGCSVRRTDMKAKQNCAQIREPGLRDSAD